MARQVSEFDVIDRGFFVPRKLGGPFAKPTSSGVELTGPERPGCVVIVHTWYSLLEMTTRLASIWLRD